MTGPNYQNFAVVGAGNLGTYIINEFLKLKAAGTIQTIVVLSRNATATEKNPDWVSQGVKFSVIDYDSPETLEKAFSGIDVVISTVGIMAISKQYPLATAAKAAAVKLFVPSEFGDPTLGSTRSDAISPDKAEFHEHLRNLDLPYSLFFTGMFSDAVWPHLGIHFDTGVFKVPGSGDSPISMTGREDIARFLTYVLTHLPPSELEWSVFRIEAERTTINKLIASYRERTDKKINLSYIPSSVLQQNYNQNPRDVQALILWALDTGRVVVGEENDNSAFPGWNPKKTMDMVFV